MSDFLWIHPTVVVLLLLIILMGGTSKLFYPTLSGGLVLLAGWIWILPPETMEPIGLFGFTVRLIEVDPLTRYFGVLLVGITLLASILSWQANADRRVQFVKLALLSVALWIVFVGDWIGLTIGWFVFGVVGASLLWIDGNTSWQDMYRFSLLYFINASLLLGAIALHSLSEFGADPRISHDHGALGPEIAVYLLMGALAISVGGVGVHIWLPEAFSKPNTDTTVFFFATLLLPAFYVTLQAFPKGNALIAYYGGLMALYGSMFAFFQPTIRRNLAYQIQAHSGIILIALGIGTATATVGGLVHMLTVVLGFGLLFGILSQLSGYPSEIRNNGIHSRNIFIGFVGIAGLILVGMPLSVGFVGLSTITVAAHDAGQNGLVGILLFSLSILTAAMVRVVFTNQQESNRLLGNTVSLSNIALLVGIVFLAFLVGISRSASTALVGESIPQYWRIWTILVSVLVIGIGVFFGISIHVIRMELPEIFDFGQMVLPTLSKRIVSGMVIAGANLHSLGTFSRQCRNALLYDIRHPAERIVRFLPSTFVRSYQQRRTRTPGVTGTKLTLEESIFIFVILLALVLLLGMVNTW